MTSEDDEAAGPDALGSAEADAEAAQARAEAARARAVELHRLAEAEGSVSAAATRRRTPRPALVALALAVALLCGLRAASGYMFQNHLAATRDRDNVAQYSAVARQGVVNLMAINYNSAQADVQRVLDSTTGQFRQQFEDTSKDLVKALQDAKVITEVNVTGVAVESMTANSAVVLVAATSQRGDADPQNRDPRTWRAVVTVTRDGGQLEISQMDLA